MSRVPLTLACGPYDRTAPLADGRVRPAGIDLNVITLQPEECFWRMMRYAEFDVAEMSLSSFAMARSRGDDRFVGLPVFLSRSFRHSAIYLPPGSDVDRAEALAGGTIGVPEYQMTAAVWVRAFLEEDHGVRADGVTWKTGGVEQAGRAERQALQLPAGFTVERLPPEQTLVDALLAGELDALVAPRVPSVFRAADSGVRRLFPDYADRERDYHRRTGTFPIMHLVVVRKDVHERYPWAAQELCKAFDAARSLALQDLADAPALAWTLPFLLEAVEAQERSIGPDPWTYGLQPNHAALTRFIGHLRAQGLITNDLEPEDLFAPSTHLRSKI